ncbi:UDP-N-acetylhexosamine pyrophosphorylase-like [Photinus pyralis]|uniref:UDP-N-acetylhexosamine pyrophosphorylase-like n=1 Tax=Photinus pyralis TaxID=7054 RepID=UPI001267232B|nr:UDP-N-acetylhexosamine pyrophosphorylase-like [Photinus pyralis]
MSTYDKFKTRVERTNQSHLLQFWEELTSEQRNEFASQLETIDFEEVNQLFQDAMARLEEDVVKIDNHMKPIPPSQLESEESSQPETLERYKRIGYQEISEGHVGVLVLAGGQGTRLGVTYPKGMYSVGLPSGKTLFQIQAERIRRVENLANEYTGKHGYITWYIMTSGPTEEATEGFLKTHNFFGLRSENVVQFRQGLLPCFDLNGRILLENKKRLALAPDGNGGLYRALRDQGILNDMLQRGIRHLHIHSVDNILVKVADPAFIGYCVGKKADCGAKIVRKSSPMEEVGVVCQIDGRFQVVEYSEITEKTANLRDKEGTIVFSAGNICNHYFSINFLNEIVTKHLDKLKLHVAKKKIPFIDENGDKIKPDKPNGIKMEKYVYDVFQFSDHFVTWEVPRHAEFSALKYSDDVERDCPSSSRKNLFSLHKKYIVAAGGTVVGDIVEISPLISYSGENLKEKVEGKVFHEPVLLNYE